LSAADAKEKDPAALSKGTVHEWKSGDGLAYQYRIPRDYDPISRCCGRQRERRMIWAV